MAMTLRPSPEQNERLRETAKREGRSMQEVALIAIDEYTTRRAARREAFLREFVAERRDLLDRLADS